MDTFEPALANFDGIEIVYKSLDFILGLEHEPGGGLPEYDRWHFMADVTPETDSQKKCDKRKTTSAKKHNAPDLKIEVSFRKNAYSEWHKA